MVQEAERLRGQLAELRSEKELEKGQSDAKVLHLEMSVKRLEAQASAHAGHSTCQLKESQGRLQLQSS